MHKHIILLSFYGLVAACTTGDPVKMACMDTTVSMTVAELNEISALDALQEKRIDGCTTYFAKQQTDNSSRSMQALLERAEANSLLENRGASKADVEALKALLANTRKESHPDFKRGAGLTLAVLDAMNSDDPLAVLRPLVKKNPYLEPLHQIAFSYAVEQGDYLSALEYLYLSERLPSGEGLAGTKGYLLELAGLNNAALREYEKTTPTMENRIRLAHLFLAQGEREKSLIAFAEAKTLAAEPDKAYAAKEIIFKVAANYRGDENLLTANLNQRLAVLEVVHKDQPAVDAQNQLVQLAQGFSHSELDAALKYVSAQVGNSPLLVQAATSNPKPLTFSLLERVADIRKVALTNLPDFMPGGAFSDSVSTYSKKMWFLKPTGFSHKRLKNGTVEVTFDGSSATDRARLVEMALFRASELAIKNVKPFFSLRTLDHFNKYRPYNGVSERSPKAQKVKMVIKFHDRLPKGAKAFRSKDVYRALSPVYFPLRTAAR